MSGHPAPPVPEPGARPVRQLPAVVEVVALSVLGALTGVVEVLFLPERAAGVPVPLAALVAAGVNVLLVRAAAERTTRTVVAAAPLLAWVVVVLGSALPGPGGDVVLVNDWRAVVLLVAGVVAPAVTLGVVMGRNAVLRAAGAPRDGRPAPAGAQSPR